MWVVLTVNTTYGKCEKMLIVGPISTIEEQREVKFIAEIFIIGERIRYIAREQKKLKNK